MPADRRLAHVAAGLVLLGVAPSAAAAAPPAGYWFGSNGHTVASFMVRHTAGHRARITDFQYRAGSTSSCHGLHPNASTLVYVEDATIAASGAFDSPIVNGSKAHAAGRATSTAITGIAELTKHHGASQDELRCYRQRFAAHHVANPDAVPGRYDGTVAEQPRREVTRDDGAHIVIPAIAAQRVVLTVQRGGYRVDDDGPDVRVNAVCPTSSTQSYSSFEDLRLISGPEFPIGPDKTLTETEAVSGTTQDVVLRFAVRNRISGAIAVTSRQDGITCRSGPIAITAIRRNPTHSITTGGPR